MREAPSAGIGGFIGLEDPLLPSNNARAAAWPASGEPYSTGRAAFRAILETTRPTLVYLPSFICRVILEPLRSTGTAWSRYPTALDLSHQAAPVPRDGELLLVIDHFGLQGAALRSLAARDGRRLVVDATQALFADPAAGAWAFTSTRKFLGVPDGATAHGPWPVVRGPRDGRDTSITHLELRAAGRLEAARSAFLRHEETLDDRCLAPSGVTESLLSRIDLDRVVARRRANFETLQRRLGPQNELAVSLPSSGAPHAYPFVPRHAVDRGALHRRRIFVPTFWPEMPEGTGPDDRGDVESNAAELARRLLPLPIDQRYGDAEMELVADAVVELLRG